MWAVLGVAGVASAATPLPHTEVLGNVVTTGCDVQWKNGACESGWKGWGDSATVEMVTAVSDPTVHGIMLTPGTAFWNGVTQEFDITGGKVLEWTLPVIPVDGTADVAIRAVFKNAAGTIVSTESRVETVNDKGEVSAWFQAPLTASTVSLFFGAKDGSDADTKVVVSSMFGGIPVDNFVNLQCQGCPECNISCQPGDLLVNTCIYNSECDIIVQDCYCQSEDDDAFQSAGDWQQY